MVPVVELTQQDMVFLFDKWNKEAAEKGWDKLPDFDANLQAEYFFEQAQILIASRAKG